MENAIIGFLDESSHHVNTNTARLWSFEKLKVRKNTQKKERINSFGFYSLNGENAYSAKESSKKEEVADFLYEIRERNPVEKIVVVIDNFASHKSRKVKVTAKKLNIKLVFLPPYSPDLNPIEFIWKSIKREISSMFLMCKEELKEIVETLFYIFASSISFAKSWVEKFLVASPRIVVTH